MELDLCIKNDGHGLVTENPLKMGKLSMFILLPNVLVCISFSLHRIHTIIICIYVCAYIILISKNLFDGGGFVEHKPNQTDNAESTFQHN